MTHLDLADDIIQIDNFTVHLSTPSSQQQPWDDIKGVSMLYPKASLIIEEPAYLSSLLEPEEKQGRWERNLEVELVSQQDNVAEKIVEVIDNEHGVNKDDKWCFYFVAKLLYELFANEAFLDQESSLATLSSHQHNHSKKVLQEAEGEMDRAKMRFQIPSVNRMQHLGIPASLCLMEQNLLEVTLKGHMNHSQHSDSPRDAYKSLKEVVEDLHLLLLDPDRFLFDFDRQPTQQVGLRYRNDKLYGRDEEETLITDSFCRVYSGKSEAFFIGGFSGSGKSMLVNTLRARVNAVGGYVIKNKFDALSQETPLSGVISAVNELCVIIKRESTHKQLGLLVEKVMDEFGNDVVFLTRILHDFKALSSEFDCSTASVDDGAREDKMNAQSVGYMLLRFLRLVSKLSHPIMLFLDDLQWADNTALDAVHTFLSDTMGSCIFFVGTYRDNEVDARHPIFDLVKKLENSNVPTSKVALDGLQREDLNTLISDALCLYPRICYSLTDIVIQKTNGNPFFMLEFLKSLKDRRLLQYNIYQKRWVWEEEAIRAENITDNVMLLLSHKMSALSDNMQLALKVMGCLGTCTKKEVFDCLGKSAEFASVGVGLKSVIEGGFVEKNSEGDFKFIHDKIREAAYNLIPRGDKKKFHYNLASVMLSVKDGIDSDDITLLIASQLYRGKDYISTDEDASILIVSLNIDAGKIAIDRCHHDLAYIYLDTALSLLPDDSWERNYDISLQLNFLMANAANATYKYDEAEQMLHKVLSKGRCIEDKVSSYYLLSQIYFGQGKIFDAYDTYSSILNQLGEELPETVSFESISAMVVDTLRMYGELCDDNWPEKKMESRSLQNVEKFYSALKNVAVFYKPQMVGYLVCKMVQLSLNHGVCQHTPTALLNLSWIINRDGDNAAFAHLIAKKAMSIRKSFNFSPDELADLEFEYIYSVGYLEWFHSGVHRSRSALESALSSGNVHMGFLCAAQVTSLSMISGEKKLSLLLKEIDYYLNLLKTYNNEMARIFLLMYRKTVSMLIDKGEATSLEEASASPEPKTGGDSTPQAVLDMVYINETIQNHWLGYKERCCHFAQKCLDSLPDFYHEHRVIVLFYYGLNSFDMMKKKLTPPRRKEVKDVIDSLKVTASHAESNFRNKLELLEAEQYALEGRGDLAEKSYLAAISTARDYKFIHEQGLACERAGLYFKRVGNLQNATTYLTQARLCYDEWGSNVKVQAIDRELNAISALQPGRFFK